jgi:DNA-binding PadR family transcriptional regulator
VRLEIGSLYRLLGRLLAEGVLAMGESDGRRHHYSLTPMGRRVLKADSPRLADLMARVRARKLLPRTDA